jgi:hypothetical protein
VVTALFVADGDRFVPQDVARGPWDPSALHGGPTAALLARAAEQHEADDAQPMLVVRLTVELLRPVPVTPLALSARVVRPGRKVQLVEATLQAGDRDVARLLALRVRSDPGQASAATTPAPPPRFPDVETEKGPVASGTWTAFHNEGVEMRYAAGTFEEPGAATVWIRLRYPVVDGEEPSPLMRAAAAADFGNGVGAALPFTRYQFINPDLTVSLFRPPEGEWVCLDARTDIGPDGIALATSDLFDQRGAVGRSQQSVLIEAR